MPQFQMIARPLHDHPVGEHVGVYDTNAGHVLELYTDDGKTIALRTCSLSDFGSNPRVTTPSRTISDDKTIAARWNQIVALYKEGKLRAVAYDAQGMSSGKGFSCENLAEWVMTGIPANPQGAVLALFSKLGLNPSSFASGSRR
jgi:hypothetical protein